MNVALFLLFLYMFPTLVADRKHKVNRFSIFVVNLLLGWTFLGWVIALIWAVTKDAEK